MFWSEHLARLQYFDLTALGTGAGALVGLLVYEAGVYLWHRAMHASDLLWRCFHQWHHSAERLDTFGTFDNPRAFAPCAGFWDGASLQWPKMLLGRDLSTSQP